MQEPALLQALSLLLCISSAVVQAEGGGRGFYRFNTEKSFTLQSDLSTLSRNVTAWHGQEDQDKFIHGIFAKNPEKKRHFFVDLAANDYSRISNTYVLEKHYGWEGICFEANEGYLANLVAFRTCQVVSNIISDKSGQVVDFHLHGAASSTTKLKNVRADLSHQVTVTLTEALDFLNAPTEIDFLSLDVEGSELAVLRGLDFKRYQMLVIIIERPDEDTHKLLVAAGYWFVRKITNTDCVYFHPNLPNFESHMQRWYSSERVTWLDTTRDYLLNPEWVVTKSDRPILSTRCRQIKSNLRKVCKQQGQVSIPCTTLKRKFSSECNS